MRPNPSTGHVGRAGRVLQWRSSVYRFNSVLAASAAFVLLGLTGTSAAFAAGPAAVTLGTAGNYVILSKAGISTTGTTKITGNIGASPIAASAITGFGLAMDSSGTFSRSILVTGLVYAANYKAPTPAMLTAAVGDMQTAYTNAAGRPAGVTELGSGNIGGKTLVPGVYKWGTGVTIPTDVTLSGGKNDVWIFQIAGTLNISSAMKVILKGGALAQNIFWQVAGSTTLGTNSTFNGNILDKTNIALKTGAVLNGSALAQTAVTLDANTVTGIVVNPAASTYHATSPARVLDSRPTAAGHTNIGLAGKFTAGTVRTFAVAGVIGVGATSVAVPTNATAVTGNLTIVNQTAAGVVALGPIMTASGATTTINFVKGDTRANNVTLGLGSGGTLAAVYRSSTAGATIDLIFDVTGYFTPDTSGATYHTLTPGRILDTRPTGSGHTNIGLSGKFTTKSVRTFAVAGVKALGWSSALVPATATAVTGNLTVTDATSIGYVSVGPTIAPVPSTSTLNVAKGANVANGVTVALKSGKLQAVWDGTAGSSADVIFDVTGYFTSGSGGLSFYPIAPVRVLDSSMSLGLSGTFTSGTARLFTIGGTAGVPTGAAGISGNLTVLSPSSAGWALVSPEIVASPITSTLNVASGHSEANGFDVALGSGGHVALEWAGTTGSTANIALDVTGYWK